MELVGKTGVFPFITYKNHVVMSVSSNLRESTHGDNIIPEGGEGEGGILNEEQN